jgi:glycosyltransferase involved in cell wall biosynthesis
MKVTIGIPTYNRKELLVVMATSLYKSELGDAVNIRVYDDCSTEYDLLFLKKLFPTHKTITINSKNCNADKNMYQMYVDFITTGDDYFFSADSDIIFNKNWLVKGLELFKRSDGVLSLFNANSHISYKNIDSELVLKWTIGAAGTLFSRQRVLEILEQFDTIDKVSSFDWQWSHYFKSKAIPIYCVTNSLVQHIGYHGQNSNLYFDIGRNYKIESVEDGQLMNDILEKSIDFIRVGEKKKRNAFEKENAWRSNNFGYHFRKCMIIIVKKIMPNKTYNIIKNKLSL